MSGVVSVAEPLGAETLVYVEVDGQEIIASASGRTPPKAGDHIHLDLDVSNLHVFDAASGRALR